MKIGTEVTPLLDPPDLDTIFVVQDFVSASLYLLSQCV